MAEAPLKKTFDMKIQDTIQEMLHKFYGDVGYDQRDLAINMPKQYIDVLRDEFKELSGKYPSGQLTFMGVDIYPHFRNEIVVYNQDLNHSNALITPIRFKKWKL